MALSKEEWRQARLDWESAAHLTFEAVSKKLGVSKQCVQQRARRDGWVKVGTDSSINRAAYIMADVADVESNEDRERHGSPTEEAIKRATDMRTKLIMSHRAELRLHAKKYSVDSLETANMDVCRKAKLTAEIISLRQRAERLAWGLDEKEPAPSELPPITLNIGGKQINPSELGWS